MSQSSAISKMIYTSKQELLMQARQDWVYYGGARMGAKTHGCVWKMIADVTEVGYFHEKKQISKESYIELLKHDVVDLEPRALKRLIDHSDYQGQIVRKTHTMLQKSVRPIADKLYLPLGGVWRERFKAYVFPSGARIEFSHCKDENALLDYIGLNVQRMYIDECNQFPWRWIESIVSGVRTNEGHPFNAQVIMASNPGGTGNRWLLEKFVEKCEPVKAGPLVMHPRFKMEYQQLLPGPPAINESKESLIFIPSLPFDNPHVTEKYINRLKSYPPQLQQQWLHGDFRAGGGEHFDIWNSLHHVIDDGDFVYGKHWDLESHLLVRDFDYGTQNPFINHILAIDKKTMATVCVAEIAEAGHSAKKQARLSNELLWNKFKLRPKDVHLNICDPSYRTKNQTRGDVVISIEDYYREENIHLTMGNNDRVAGARVFYEAVVIPDQGVPKMRYLESCEYAINTIPYLESDPNNMEDVQKCDTDHAYDADRYALMYFMPKAMSRDDEDRVKGDTIKDRHRRAVQRQQESQGGAAKGWMGN